MSFGTWLRRERELRQVSLREIADETNISIRYLEALEEDRFDIVPGAVFTRGFLRQYADYVGLDGDEVVNSYLAARREPGSRDDDEVSVSPRRSRWTSGLMLALAFVGLLAGVGVLALYVERRGNDEPEEQSALAAPRPVLEAAPEASAGAGEAATAEEGASAAERSSAPLVAALDFEGECWIEAFADGRRIASELHVAGESLLFEAQRSLRLTLGDPAVVRLEVNGEPYDLSAHAEGRVAEVTLEAPEPDETLPSEPPASVNDPAPLR